MIKWIRNLFRPRSKQTCWTYCPRCRFELTSSKNDGSVVHDRDGLVWYTCEGCGLRTRWDFDHPAPVIVFVADYDAWRDWIDDKIDQWHDANPEAIRSCELHEFLNMTWDQYRAFVYEPKTFYAVELDRHERAL